MINFITKSFWSKNKFLVGLVFAGIVFFVFCLLFYSFSGEKFNSPDETSNYFFINLFQETGQLKFFESLNFIAENQIHPRSTTVIDGYVVPGGFLGTILIFGLFAKIFGIKIFFLVTPLFLLFSLFCFYKIVEKVFNKSIATVSSFLFLAHPAVLYYSARGLFPNILFVSLLIISIYFLIVTPFKNRKYFKFIFSGLFLGISLTIRPSEIFWIGLIYLVLFLFYRKEINYKQIIIFFSFLLLGLTPLFIYNFLTYGSIFGAAYNIPTVSAATGGDEVIVQETNSILSLFKYIFPFGFYPKSILKVFANYFTGIFWWLSVPTAMGVIYLIRKTIREKIDKKILVYFLISLLASFFLFAYYGSWIFSDNGSTKVSIGTSYVRYWLPIYILTIPLIAIVLKNTVYSFSKKFRKYVLIFLSIACLLFSLNLVLFDKSDGLLKISEDIRRYKPLLEGVNKEIEPEAVLIVDQADKIFFPEIKVTYPLRDEVTYNLMPKLIQNGPLYYYGITLPEKDINYLNEVKFKDVDVKINFVKSFNRESLYQLTTKE